MRKHNYRLHAGSPAEHVHRLDLADQVAFIPQQACVTGEGGRITGYVDNPLRCRLGHGTDHGGIQAFAGWIHTDDVRAQSVVHHPGQQLLGLAGAEGDVADTVEHGIPLRVFHRGFHDFNADGFTAVISNFGLVIICLNTFFFLPVWM